MLYYLKNESGSPVTIADLGLLIPDSQSIHIDENEINGYYTTDLATEINAGNLVLSTTDVGNSAGDYTPVQALNALSITSRIHTDNPHKVTFTQASTEDPGTDISAAEAETLTDGSDASSLHIHDNRYFTETELSTSGSATVHWDNVTNTPQFGSLHWQEPVLCNIWEAGDTATMNSSSPSDGDFWWNSDDDHLYKYDEATTSWVDQGSPSEGTRIIYRDGASSDDYIYTYTSGAWDSGVAPEDGWAVMVDDDGDSQPAQYIFDSTTTSPPNWIKISDVNWGDHNSLDGRTDANAHPASSISYNNTTSGLTADDTQEAIDELENEIDGVETSISNHAGDTSNPHSVTFTQAVTADSATDISAAEAETLTDGSNADSLHKHNASNILYDDTTSGLDALNVQQAIDELEFNLGLTSHIYVDSNRTDDYNQTGSILKPFKTISAAISAALFGQIIYVAPGSYGTAILPDGVSLAGSGASDVGTFFTDVTTGTGEEIFLKDFSYTGNLHIRTSTLADNIHSNGTLEIDSNFNASNFKINNSTETPITITSGVSKMTNIYVSTGDNISVDHNGGNITFSNSSIVNNSNTAATIESTSGILRMFESAVSNSGTANAISMNNTATAANPNILADVTYSGEIDAGSAYTIVEGTHDLSDGARIITGSNLIKRPGEQIDYDNATSGLSATNVQTAIDELASEFGVEIANVIYVAKNGSDTPPASGADLGTLANPYLTIQAAIDSIVSPGPSNYQIVYIFPGDYIEQLTIPSYVSIVGMAIEPTRIGNSGTSYTHTLDLTGGGRNAFWHVNFRNNNFSIVNTNGSASVWFDNCVTGTVTYNGLGYDDYLQFRNDCWIHGDIIVHGANLTLYDSVMDGNIECDGDGATNIWSGYTGWNTIRHSSIQGNILLEETTDTSIWNSDIYGTITADGGTSGDCVLSIDEGSAPPTRTDLIIQNSATLQLLDWAYAKGYDNTTSGLTSENVQDAIDELVGKVEAFKIPKGTSFPTSPVPEDGDLFYRTDMAMIFHYDGSRSKWLSTTEMFLDWGANAGDGKYLHIHGATATQTGYLMPRNGTIVNITAKGASGNLSKGLEIRRNHNSTALASFNLTSGEYNDANTNIDFTVGDYIQAFASSTGAPVRDIVVMCTVAWME